MDPARTLICFYKNTVSYPHHISIKVCNSPWLSINGPTGWSLNDFIPKKFFSWALPRYMRKAKTEKIRLQLKASETTTLLTSLHSFNKLLKIDVDTNCYPIPAAHYLVCLTTETQRGAALSYTGKAMINYVLQTTNSIYTASFISV